MHAVLLIPMTSTSWTPPLNHLNTLSAAPSMVAVSHGVVSQSNDANLGPGAQKLPGSLTALFCASVGSYPSSASSAMTIDPDMIFLDNISPLSGSLNVPLGGVHPADVYTPSLAPFTDVPSMFALGQAVTAEAPLGFGVFLLLAFLLSDLAVASVSDLALPLPGPNISNQGVLREQAFTNLLAEKVFLPSLTELSESCFCIAEDASQAGHRLFICATASDEECTADEAFSAYYGKPVFLCQM